MALQTDWNAAAFSEELSGMMAHYKAHADRFGAGSYWDPIARMVLMQSRVTPVRNLYEAGWYYAASFSGSPANSIAAVNEEESRSWKYRFWGKVLSAFYRFGLYWPVLHPLWRAAFAARAAARHASNAQGNYQKLVSYAFELFKDDIIKYGLASPEIFGVDLVAVAGDRKLSFKTVSDFNVFLRIRELTAGPTDRIVEIGAGVGELARIFWKTGSCRKYVVVDIPPTLAFSQEFLTQTCGAGTVDRFDADRAVVDFDNGRTFYFLTPDQIALVPEFDLGINIASFGEMEAAIVRNYVDSIKRSGFREFLSINQRLRKTGNAHGFGEAEYAEYFGPEFEIVTKRTFGGSNIRAVADRPQEQGYQLLVFSRRGA